MRKPAKQDIPLIVSRREMRIIKYYVPGTPKKNWAKMNTEKTKEERKRLWKE